MILIWGVLERSKEWWEGFLSGRRWNGSCQPLRSCTAQRHWGGNFLWEHFRWIYRAQGWGFCHKSCEPNWQKKGFILRKVKTSQILNIILGRFFYFSGVPDNIEGWILQRGQLFHFFKISGVPLCTWKGGQCAKRQPWPWIEGQHRKRAVCSFHSEVPAYFAIVQQELILTMNYHPLSQEVCWLCELHCERVGKREDKRQVESIFSEMSFLKGLRVLAIGQRKASEQ